MIEIKNLTQRYFNKEVLKDVSLTIEKNERCALVGRNGAGKSTFIRTMLGLQSYKTGTIELGGHSNKKGEWKKIVSYLPEKFSLYSNLTGKENIEFFAAVNNNKVDQEKIEEKLKLVSLWGDHEKYIREYSKGMLQRLGLAIMLYYDSEIIILDEPTSGLDPMGRNEILSIINSLENKTILMASHHFEEIKKVCTHVAYIKDGKITKHTVDSFIENHLREDQKL